MSALHEFQDHFRAFLVDGAPVPPSVAARFVENADIHRNNVREAHVGALRAVYPAIVNLIGEAYFDTLAAAYTGSHPPRSSVLGDYGAGFAAHIAACEDLSDYPFLPEVAHLEWAWNEAFHAHSSFSMTPQDAADLIAADAETIFTPLPSARLLRARFPVLEIRNAALDDDGETLSSLAPRVQNVLIMRPANAVLGIAISDGEFAMVETLINGGGLERAFARALAEQPSLSSTDAFAALLNFGVFVRP